MELVQQSNGGERLMCKGGLTLDFTRPAAYGRPIHVKLPQNVPEDVECDSKSVQLPSLTDGSSRSSSIYSERIASLSESLSAASDNIKYNAYAAKYEAWSTEDENASLLPRTESPGPLGVSTILR